MNEERLMELFEYFRKILPIHIIASNFSWESYEHKRKAQESRDRLAMDTALKLLEMEEKNE